MAELTRTERTAPEVASLRVQAAEMLAGPAAASEYMRWRCGAVLDTCDWIGGERALSPASESDLSPTLRGLRHERMRAEDLEGERRRAGESAGATHAGVVGQTLNWYLLDPDTEPPL